MSWTEKSPSEYISDYLTFVEASRIDYWYCVEAMKKEENKEQGFDTFVFLRLNFGKIVKRKNIEFSLKRYFNSLFVILCISCNNYKISITVAVFSYQPFYSSCGEINLIINDVAVAKKQHVSEIDAVAQI